MYKMKRFFRKLFTPVTIMMVPHDGKKTINLKVPSIGIISSFLLWIIGSIYVITIAVDTVKYYHMENKLSFYTEQFVQLKSTIYSLKKSEIEFRRLLSFGSREKILENVDTKINTYDAGSIDMNMLRDQIKNTIGKVTVIQEYLKKQKDAFMTTPKGWPVSGRITSPFGNRENPKHGGSEFHSGMDIAVSPGTPVRSTADGIVSFSGWSAGNGNLVVVEHGSGFSTFYAHNSSNAVSVGKKVRRDTIIAYTGSTGNSTGPHLHYEVWKNGRPVDPKGFIMEVRNVSKEK